MRIFSLIKSRAFVIGGVVSAAWPLIIALLEILDCHPHWQSMCGTGVVFLDFPGYILSFPLIAVVEVLIKRFDLLQGTPGYLLLISCMMVVHYVAGGFIGLFIAKIFRRKTPKALS